MQVLLHFLNDLAETYSKGSSNWYHIDKTDVPLASLYVADIGAMDSGAAAGMGHIQAKAFSLPSLVISKSDLDYSGYHDGDSGKASRRFVYMLIYNFEGTARCMEQFG